MLYAAVATGQYADLSAAAAALVERAEEFSRLTHPCALFLTSVMPISFARVKPSPRGGMSGVLNRRVRHHDGICLGGN